MGALESKISPETKENVVATAKESSLILLYECIGTAMMTLLITNYYAQISQPPCSSTVFNNSTYGGCKVEDNTGLLLGMFVTIMFSARISGSHFNPCITFSYMLGNVKHGKFDRILGFLYMIAQCVGALLGAFIGLIFYSGHAENKDLPNGFEYGIKLNVKGDDIIQQMIVEILGSFFLVFMYLSSTEEKTKFTKDSAVQTIILAGSYLGAMFLAGTKIESL